MKLEQSFDSANISQGVLFIESLLKKLKVPSKNIATTELTAEEIMVKMASTSLPDEKIVVSIYKSFFGEVTIKISSKGEQFRIDDAVSSLGDLLDDNLNVQADEALRNLVLKNLSDTLDLQYTGSANVATIKAFRPQNLMLVYTFIAIFLGIAIGALLKTLLPIDFAKSVSSNIFEPVTVMFLNAVKMIVAPLVFFSITSSIANIGDMRFFGKVGLKVILCYFFTSVIAILLAYGVYSAIPVGNVALAQTVSDSASNVIKTSQSVSISLKNTIISIVPSNIVKAFSSTDMMQIIFIAVLCGLVSGLLGDKYRLPRQFFIEFNAFFGKITAIIIKTMPLSVFCSIASMTISLKSTMILSMIPWLGLIYLTNFLMMGIYSLLLLIFGRVSPFKFFKKFHPAMFTAFSCASSNATMPVSLDLCGKKLGISKKIYSLSIPLGATVNMDGSCIFIMISSLFLAKVFGIEIDSVTLVNLMFSVFVLSVGAPGVPGAGLVCLALVLPIIGVPTEAISLIMGFYQLNAMIQVCTNVTGDATVSTVIAAREKLLDLEKYNS